MLSKEEREKAYWEGYIAKQNEAMEICKQCKYIKKVKQLELREQKLIEKLEEDTNKPIPLAEDMDWIRCRKEYAKEILEILK